MARRVISSAEMTELKKQVAKRFSTELHYRDSCGGQNFSMTSSSPELHEYLTQYFGGRGISLKFSADGLRFYTM